MPAVSASQQRLFGMVHAYQAGKLKHAPDKVRDLAGRISEEDAGHFARTRHDGLPERKGKKKKLKKAASDLEALVRAIQNDPKGVLRLFLNPNFPPGRGEALLGALRRRGDGGVAASGGPPLAGALKAAEGTQQVVVGDGRKKYVFPSIKPAAVFISAKSGVSVEEAQVALYRRTPEVGGFSVEYPENPDASDPAVPAEAAPGSGQDELKLSGSYSPSGYGL